MTKYYHAEITEHDVDRFLEFIQKNPRESAKDIIFSSRVCGADSESFNIAQKAFREEDPSDKERNIVSTKVLFEWMANKLKD